MVGGCSNPFDVYGNCTTSSGDPELDPPLAMILGETWITSPEAWETASSLVNILGQIGYYYEDGVYVKEELADAALANNVMLAWWESYVAPTNYSPGARAEPSEWFEITRPSRTTLGTTRAASACKKSRHVDSMWWC